jgi:hypothetical protein
VESEVLEQKDLTVLSTLDGLLDVLSHTVVKEGNVLLEQLRELVSYWLEGVLGVGGSVGSTEVRHEDDGLGTWRLEGAVSDIKGLTIVNGVLDGGEGSDDSLLISWCPCGDSRAL